MTTDQMLMAIARIAQRVAAGESDMDKQDALELIEHNLTSLKAAIEGLEQAKAVILGDGGKA